MNITFYDQYCFLLIPQLYRGIIGKTVKYLKCTMCRFDIRRRCERISPSELIDTSVISMFTSFFFLIYFFMRMFKFLANFKYTVLPSMVTALYVRFLGLIHLITEGLCPLTSLSLAPGPTPKPSL